MPWRSALDYAMLDYRSMCVNNLISVATC